MIKIFLLDDEPKAVDTLSKVLLTFFDNVELVGTANTIDLAYHEILKTKPDLLLLDVEMGQESGFQLLEKFEEIKFHIAFVTAHEAFALKAIKFSALDYIIKPASVQELKQLIHKVEKNSQTQNVEQKVKHMFGNFITSEKSEHKITISVSEGYEFLKVDDILYLRADGSYTVFCLKDGRKITSSKNLKFFESILIGYGFFRIHNSTMVNLKYIKKYNKGAGGFVVMDNDEEFSLSKSRKEEFIELLYLR